MTPEVTAILEQFEEAVREHAWMGSQRPCDFREIQRQYDEAKEVLVSVLEGGPDI